MKKNPFSLHVNMDDFLPATEEEKAINFCNSGMMCFDGKVMFDILNSIKKLMKGKSQC